MSATPVIRLESIHPSALRALDLREEAAKALLFSPPERLDGPEVEELLDRYPAERAFSEMLVGGFRFAGDLGGEALLDFEHGRIGIATNGSAAWGDVHLPAPLALRRPDEYLAAAHEGAVLDAVRDAIVAWSRDPDWAR